MLLRKVGASSDSKYSINFLMILKASKPSKPLINYTEFTKLA